MHSITISDVNIFYRKERMRKGARFEARIRLKKGVGLIWLEAAEVNHVSMVFDIACPRM